MKQVTKMKVLSLLMVVLVGIVGGFGWWFVRLGKPMLSGQSSQDDADHSVTLFLPGYFGNRFSFGFLLRRLVRNYHANKSLVIHVTGNGQLKFTGTVVKNRCVVQVLFHDKTSRPKQQAEWLTKICEVLHDDYGVERFNLVGHSMGCITIFWYLTHQHRHSQVEVANVVAIAGPFNDSEIARNTRSVDSFPLNANGPTTRTPVYSALARNISDIPDNMRVLNIAGRISNYQTNDGQVSVNSAFSLRYLLERPLVYYRELIINGRHANHRQLHENRLVDDHIARFLWHQ